MRQVRVLVLTLVLGVLAWAPASEAQPAGQTARIGFLTTARAGSPSFNEFRQALRDIGYIDGQNIVLEERAAAGNLDRLPELAADLVRLKVHVIAALGNEGIRAAKEATTTIPIVMRFASDDPVASGFIASYARPGGNVTGVTLLSPALEAKRLELLKEVVPGVSRIAVLVHPARIAFQLRDTVVAARALGVQLQVVEARDSSQYAGAFSAMMKGRAGALVVMSHPVFSSDRQRLVELATKSRLPAMYHWREFVDAGGLMAYGPNFVELNRLSASYVDRILKGAKPGDLPVEGPTKFELTINARTARALGLAVPRALVERADHVVQ